VAVTFGVGRGVEVLPPRAPGKNSKLLPTILLRRASALHYLYNKLFSYGEEG
jgi:hypothetical protein